MATSSSKRDRARVIALSALVLCCVGFVGGLFYLQNRPEPPLFVGVPHAPDPQLVAETEERKKEKILELRDKWQVWAKGHQPQLRAMLHAQPNDSAALQSVTTAIPAFPSKSETGFGAEEFSGIKNFSDPVVLTLSYIHFDFRVTNPTSQDEEQEAKHRRYTQLRDEAGFNQLRDVVVVGAESSWSKKSYCLWASGRVTESEDASPDITQFLKKSYVTISPSYDFLAS